MNCPYCGEDELDPPSPLASFAMYECGTRYDNGDYTQSSECEFREKFSDQIIKKVYYQPIPKGIVDSVLEGIGIALGTFCILSILYGMAWLLLYSCQQ